MKRLFDKGDPFVSFRKRTEKLIHARCFEHVRLQVRDKSTRRSSARPLPYMKLECIANQAAIYR